MYESNTQVKMNATKTSLLAVLMIAACVLQGFAVVPESNEKPVKFVVEFYPNYAGHLLGVANIGYQSDYADTYQYAVRPRDLDYLRENGSLLKWEPGDEGPLTSVFVTFPAYINPSTKEELADYLLELNSAIAIRSFDSFYSKYYGYIKDLDRWCGFSVNSYIYEYEEEIQRISQILINKFDNFKYWVWPRESVQMIRLANLMNYQISKLDLIRRWEEKTGIDFKAPAYKVALSSGMANGPTGKSLGYEKEWCYYGENQHDLFRRICQDAGRRILINVCSDKYQEYDPLLCYQVYETMNEYFTKMILAEAGWKYYPSGILEGEEDLCAIFDSIIRINPEIKAQDLYAIALEDYSRIHSLTSQ